MKKYAAVTFIFNGYDLLREPLNVEEEFDYYCLTDDKSLKSDTWKCIYIPELDSSELTDRQKVNMAKYNFNKYLPKEYEYWICIDASVKILGNMSKVIEYFEDNNFDAGFSIQMELKSYKDECYEFKEYGRIDDECIETFRKYTVDNNIDWEEKTGILEGTMKIYKNTKLVVDLLEEICSIYEEVCNYKDLDDQRYLTIGFSKYDDKLNTCFFYRQLYHNSDVFERYEHNTDRIYLREYTEEENNHILFGKQRILKTF